jgi:hypothetical protein
MFDCSAMDNNRCISRTLGVSSITNLNSIWSLAVAFDCLIKMKTRLLTLSNQRNKTKQRLTLFLTATSTPNSSNFCTTDTRRKWQAICNTVSPSLLHRPWSAPRHKRWWTILVQPRRHACINAVSLFCKEVTR